MADGVVKEQQGGQIEIISGEEDLLAAARKFKWTNPEKSALGEFKTNLEVISESIEELGRSDVIEDTEGTKSWVREIREKANAIYREIYPQWLEEGKKVLEAPYYHGIAGKEDWFGHNDYVMATTARMFSGLVKLKKTATKEQLVTFDKFFGPNWQAKELTLVDFKTLMAMAAFHEVGEWWIKSFWEEGLARQRKQFNEQLNAGLAIEDFVIDPTLKKIVWELKEEVREKGIRNTNFVIDEVREAIGEFGIKIRYDGEDREGEASEFYLDFVGGRPEDLAFAPEEEPKPTGKKPFILARLFKAADFAQVIDPEYLEKVDYLPWGEVGKSVKGLRKGPLVLWPEFYAFKPGALKILEAARPEDVQVSQKFYGLLKKNFLNEPVLQILDQCFASPEQNPYRQGAEIIGEPFGDNFSS